MKYRAFAAIALIFVLATLAVAAVWAAVKPLLPPLKFRVSTRNKAVGIEFVDLDISDPSVPRSRWLATADGSDVLRASGVYVPPGEWTLQCHTEHGKREGLHTSLPVEGGAAFKITLTPRQRDGQWYISADSPEHGKLLEIPVSKELGSTLFEQRERHRRRTDGPQETRRVGKPFKFCRLSNKATGEAVAFYFVPHSYP